MMGTRVKRLAMVLAIGFSGGVLGHLAMNWLQPAATADVGYLPSGFPARLAGNRDQGMAAPIGSPGEFADAAAAGTQSVVFIQTTSNAQQRSDDDFWSLWDFFGNRGPISSAGSGVILSEDGYIVTNNHVVQNADRIEVSLTDKRTFPAVLVGTDPNTDLAVLKIDARNLKAIPLANSDGVRIGDWVLAIGNPFNLQYTVTAGIVSAKGRNINILNSQFPIESFIQTDAAINPGNSGGALVNLNGELIGINAAIATRTGAYNGYGFAIPANIVRKVVADLKEFGQVQRAFLGAEVVDIDSRTAGSQNPADLQGVMISAVSEDGPAKDAGLKKGDIVLEIGGVKVNTKSEYLEHLSYYRPGDKVMLKVKKAGQVTTPTLQLENEEGTTTPLRKTVVSFETLGADIAPLSKAEKQRYRVENGYRISNIRSGRLARIGIPEGFIILSMNDYAPETVQELAKLLESARGRIIIEGLSSNGQRQYLQYYSN